MQLDKVHIINFRSIKDLEIKFSPRCRVLVGINETGKTNIIKALRLLDKNINPKPEDIREPSKKEKEGIREAYVDFVFKLDPLEINNVSERLEPKILSNSKNYILKNANKNYTLKEFCELKKEGCFEVDIIKANKSAKYYTLEDGYELIGNWKKVLRNCPPNLEINIEKDKKIKLLDKEIINCDDYPDVPKEYLEDVDPEYVNQLVGKEIIKIIDKSLPKVIFWSFDENNLLPPQLNLLTFAKTPDICIPLKNMFELAGITNIQEAINATKSKRINSLHNLLDRVATHTTNHFRRVWREYKTIRFKLLPNGDNLDVFIEEENLWNFQQRSDGFKRFITFLLIISVAVQSKTLSDFLLLIDEPDISLHPSGAKYLKEELIKISRGEKNYVVYSTHSIFMIDSDYIPRHIIVKKNNEITSIEDANESNLVEEEVLFNALGWSIYQSLPKKNIIFEGWTDKKLFKTALDNLPHDKEKIKNNFQEIGLCHGTGAPSIKSFTPILELAKRKCLIISDNDPVAKQKQKEYEAQKGYGIWKRYDQINSKVQSITAEDFLVEDTIKTIISKIKEKYPALNNEPDVKNNDRISAIKKWLKENVIDKDTEKEIIKQFKELLFENLDSQSIDKIYYTFMDHLAKTIEDL